MRRPIRLASSPAVAAIIAMMGCKFPYPPDVLSDAGPDGHPGDSDAAIDAAPPPVWAIVAVHTTPQAPATEPVRVYQPDGNGRYASAWMSNELDFGTSVAVADFDGDGDLDIAVGNFSLNNSARNRVYRNDGDTFTLVWASAPQTTTALAWADVDRDGDPDLVAATLEGVLLYRNAGGQLGLPAQLLPDGAFDLDLGDIDGDGDPDLIIADGQAGSAGLYINDGTGAFQRRPWNGPTDEISVRFGDYDADGDLDVAVGRERGFNVYRAEGTTLVYAFGASELLPAFTSRSNVAWIDHDGDGDLDLLAGHCTPLLGATCAATPVTIFQNLGGSFARAWTSPTVDKTTSVAVGDFNNDGRPDLILGNDGAPLRLYRNTGGAFAETWTSVESEHTTAVAWLPLQR
jgi:hypothetical protein